MCLENYQFDDDEQRGHDHVHCPELEVTGFQTLEVPGLNHCPQVLKWQ